MLVKFNQENAGKEKRAQNKKTQVKYPGATKVKKYNLTYTLSGKTEVGHTANIV